MNIQISDFSLFSTNQTEQLPAAAFTQKSDIHICFLFFPWLSSFVLVVLLQAIPSFLCVLHLQRFHVFMFGLSQTQSIQSIPSKPLQGTVNSELWDNYKTVLFAAASLLLLYNSLRSWNFDF